MKKILAGIILFLAAALSAAAQINVEAPRVVGLNEQFNITFTLGEKPSEFSWNQGDSFQLVWGPQTGSSTSISIINGKHTKESRYTYTYVLLPRQNGTFSLPAAHAVVGGKEVYSKAVSIEVVSNGAGQSAASGASAGSSATAGQSPQAVQSQTQQASGNQSSQRGEDIFMRLSLSRTSAVVGEPINATLKLYTRSSVAGFEDAKFPSFNGFWAQETESPQNINFQRESVGDRIYNSAVLRRWVIIPQKAGAVTIDAAELVCLLQQRISTGNSIFDGFFDDYQTIRKRIVTPAVTVNVSALPGGAPASFTGAVGTYRIKASLSSDSLKVHDAASLMVSVSGKGNVALVGAPKVNFPPDSELYDVKTSDRLDAGSGGTSGVKTFEYPFIPRSYGDFEIPALEFTYYDISARKYVTLTTDAIPYHVERGATTDYVPSEGVNIPVNARKDVKNLNDDIHYISTRLPKLSSESTFFVGTAMFWVLIALFAFIAAAVYCGVSAVRSRRSDVVKVRTRGASKAARKRLSVAGGYLQKNLYSAYYEELHKALLGYAADKLNMSLADLSKDSISAAFMAAGAQEGLVKEYTALLDECEYARYAPSQGNDAMKESYDKAVDVISALDANMKKTSKGNITGALIALVLLCGGFNSFAGNETYVDSLWTSAVQAYSEGNYLRSAADFSAIEAAGLASPELYTNIADAYFKNQEYGQAILYYERALKLNPSYKDAGYNLEIARQMTLDKIESVPEFFLNTWARKLCYSLPPNTWTALFFAFFALTLAMVVVFFLARTSLWRKIPFFSAIVSLLLSALCISCAWVQKSHFETRDEAIVTRAVCAAKSSPSAVSGADLFVLHEGTKVKILDTVGEWTNIAIADGREAWVLSVEITVI